MSQKWIRSKAWDDQHLTGALLPVRFLARLFSSVYFGVGLLVLVACYGILASVPIGLIALAPTWIIYAFSLVVVIGLVAGLPLSLGARVMATARVPIGARFALGLIGGLALTVGAVIAWRALVWPRMHYDALTHTGFRMFGTFVDQYKTMQFRRLPIMEMSELEFYAWWPLQVILVLFVSTMVFSTLRRIEFSFPYIGVITVHTGIVTIALGSLYYASHKQEGDMLLTVGDINTDGTPGRPGQPETGFYDNTRTALWVQQPDKAVKSAPPGGSGGWEMRRLSGVPRYHDYNLNVLGQKTLPPIMTAALAADRGPLAIDAPAMSSAAAVDPDIRFRVVGYTPYAELIPRMLRAGEIDASKLGTATPESVRTIEAYLRIPPSPAEPDSGDPSKPRKVWRLMPDSPARRVDILTVQDQPLLGVEYTRGMSDKRWRDLAAPLPRGTQHALIVRHPATGFEAIYPAVRGSRISVGDTGYALTVEQLAAEPPFPLVTRGYQGAKSSIAVVHVDPPKTTDGKAAPRYERWVYHRFPEISQDLLDEPVKSANASQPPMSRRNADPDIEIVYIDASIIQIYFDESAASAGKPSTARALVRLPGGGATVTPSVAPGSELTITEGFTLKLAESYDDALRVEFPVPIPASQQDSKLIGAHQRAAVAVEVSATVNGKDWKTTLWVPFSQYLDPSGQGARLALLPDGRSVRVAFGRVRHEFWPPMAIALADFTMTPYPHSQTPRDYSSELMVMNRWGDGATLHQERHKTSLNDPLLVRTPFQPRTDVPKLLAPIINGIGWAFEKVAPNQYKFSQAGWDQEGWTESAAAVERGEMKRAFARYTILGVGNNPGIYIIAAGAVMMSVGIPWAFYIKPLIVRRRKKKIQEQLAAGTYVGRNGKPISRPPAAAPQESNEPQESTTGVQS